MWEQAAGQIEAIHSMMATGHRSVTLERHTLFLWGIATAVLIIVVRQLFTPEWLPVMWQRAVLSTLFISTVLTLVGILDLRLTRRAREARDETLSFIQVQLTKVWWGIIAIIVMINLGMHFFGGGYLFYPIMVALVGLAFYIHGLFSQQLLSWVGVMMVLLGLSSIALQLSLMTMEWLTIAIFGIGFPVLAWLLNWRPAWLKQNYRVVFSFLWLSTIALPTYAMVQIDQQQHTPAIAVVSLQQYQHQSTAQAASHIVRLPVGTTIPLQIVIHSPVLAAETRGTVALQLSQPLDIVVQDGKPNGQYRVGTGPWNDRRYQYSIRNVQIASKLTRELGPQVDVSLDIITPH